MACRLERLPRGCACFLIIPFLIGFVVLLICFFAERAHYSWCSAKIEAGDCELYEKEIEGRIGCFCIDGDKPKNDTIGLYKQAAQNCQQLNGSLATPDTIDVLVWLAKRMYRSGFDNALIGMKKSEGVWYWDKIDTLQKATNIAWHPDFPPTEEHTHAVVTVETVEKEIEGNDYEYQYYNYDHYLEHDKNTEPQISLGPPATEEAPLDNQVEKDECYCGNEEISLSDLDASHTFQSPRYPKNYCSDLICRWTISTNHNFVIKLEWLVFDTETDMDFVFIYDGETSDHPLIDRCSGNHCGDATSSTDAMHINFNSDHVTTDLGFRGRVSAIDPDPCYCSKLTKITFSNMVDSYTISSPKYPIEYCATNKCAWTISVQEKVGLQIVWNAFGIETRDHVFVHDGQSRDDMKILSCPGNNCNSAITDSQHMHIYFSTEGIPSKRVGFSAVITPVVNYCEKGAHGTSNGTVAYSGEREDGRIQNRGTATLTCFPDTKIPNTYDVVQGTVSCVKFDWSRQFRLCVPVCQISVLPPPPEESDFGVCTRQQSTDAQLVESSHTVKRFDSANGSETQLFTCGSFGWTPEEPICHFDWMGILVIGGFGDKSMELYNPLEDTQPF